MDFYNVLEQVDRGQAFNPYAVKSKSKNWIKGTISIEFLNNNFSQYEAVDEMITATESEGLKKFFQGLKDEGKID